MHGTKPQTSTNCRRDSGVVLIRTLLINYIIVKTLYLIYREHNTDMCDSHGVIYTCEVTVALHIYREHIIKGHTLYIEM